MKESMKPWMTLLLAIATSLFGGAIGYGVSQMQLAAVVAVHENRIRHTETRIEQVAATSSLHMKEAVELFKEAEKSRQETERTAQRLIALLESSRRQP